MYWKIYIINFYYYQISRFDDIYIFIIYLNILIMLNKILIHWFWVDVTTKAQCYYKSSMLLQALQFFASYLWNILCQSCHSLIFISVCHTSVQDHDIVHLCYQVWDSSMLKLSYLGLLQKLFLSKLKTSNDNIAGNGRIKV